MGHAPGIHFLNFDKDRRDVFNVVIFDKVHGQFDESLDALYEGKIVRVRGRVVLFKDHTQIRLASPKHIEVLHGVAPSTLDLVNT